MEGDKYAAEFVTATFRDHGIAYQASERDRSGNYAELLPLINAGRVRLLDDVELLRELRGPERRRGPSRDRIDHRPGSHDDRAVAATVAMVEAAGAPRAEQTRAFARACFAAGATDPTMRLGFDSRDLPAPSPWSSTFARVCEVFDDHS